MEETIVTEFTTEYEHKSFGRKFKDFFKNMSSVRQILLWYLIISLTGALLLYLPFSHSRSFNENNGAFGLGFIDALFVSSSAFSDTGLSPVGIADTFNWFGELVTLLLLQVGGVGWFTIKIFILTFILRKATTYNTIADGSSELGTYKKNETLGLIFTAVVISLGASFIGGIIFSLIFYFTGVENIAGYGDALWTGIYHASASINNSGLDIFSGNDSMNTLYGKTAGIKIGWEVTIEVLTLSLFVLGGMGFGIIYDLWCYAKAKSSGKTFAFSLVTKISVVAYVSVALVGLGLTYLSEGLAILGESSNAFLSSNWEGASGLGAFHVDSVGLINDLTEGIKNGTLFDVDPDGNIIPNSETWDHIITDLNYDASFVGTSVAFRWWTVTFNTFSTRNAGFATMSLGHLQDSTKLIYSAMMFIGSGPGSTAGGLRTTTFAIIIVSLWSSARNKPQAYAFNKGISNEVIRKAFAILCLSLGIVFVDTFLISVIEFSTGHSANSFIDNMFVVFSAYGTTGLSIADLGTYNWMSKLIVILLMFIGQMGISNTMNQIKSKQIKHQKQYIEEHINLG